MGESKRDRKELLRRICDEDVNTIFGAKSSILNKFEVLFEYTVDFDEFPELERYHSLLDSHGELEKRPLILFCFYRLSRNFKNKDLKDFECDCCKGVTEFYKTIYDWLKDFACEPQTETLMKYWLRHPEKNILFKGDTMTSVFTPLKEYIKLKLGISRTSSLTEDWELYWLKNKGSIELSKAAYDFIWRACSPANFFPVPQGFNTGRSNFGKWDSWDLTLKQIYQWYLDNPQMNNQTNNRSLVEMFQYSSNKEDAILHCVEWLKSFALWGNFVEQNYMQSFLWLDGRPKKFFQNHTLEYGLPKTIEEYEEFFENVVFCIEKRGDAMDKRLNNSLKLFS